MLGVHSVGVFCQECTKSIAPQCLTCKAGAWCDASFHFRASVRDVAQLVVLETIATPWLGHGGGRTRSPTPPACRQHWAKIEDCFLGTGMIQLALTFAMKMRVQFPSMASGFKRQADFQRLARIAAQLLKLCVTELTARDPLTCQKRGPCTLILPEPWTAIPRRKRQNAAPTWAEPDISQGAGRGTIPASQLATDPQRFSPHGHG